MATYTELTCRITCLACSITLSPAVSVPSQVSFSAGGRGAQEVCFSAAQRIFSFVSGFVLYWRASTRGGVSAANEITGIIQVIQRLHPTPGS